MSELTKLKSPSTFGNLQVEIYDEKKYSVWKSSESLPLTNSEPFIMCASFCVPARPLYARRHTLPPFHWVTLPNRTIDVVKNEKINSNFCNGGLGVAPANGQTLSKLPIKQKINTVHVLVGCPTHDLLIYARPRRAVIFTFFFFLQAVCQYFLGDVCPLVVAYPVIRSSSSSTGNCNFFLPVTFNCPLRALKRYLQRV